MTVEEARQLMIVRALWAVALTVSVAVGTVAWLVCRGVVVILKGRL